MSSSLQQSHVHRRDRPGLTTSVPRRVDGARYATLVLGVALVLLALGLALHGPVGG